MNNIVIVLNNSNTFYILLHAMAVQLHLLLWVLLLEVSSEVSLEVSCSQLSLLVWSSTELKGNSILKFSEPKP